MSARTNLPPLSSDGVFSVSASIIIDAPRDKVWKILLDFPKYNEWNPFVRGQIMVSKSDKKPLDDQTPIEGAYVLMSPVHIPPTMDDSSVWFPSSSAELITMVDHENYCCSWAYVSLPQWLLSSNRWQGLTADEGGKTKYESILVFTGLLAYILKFVLRKGLKGGCQAMGEALKRRSEES